MTYYIALRYNMTYYIIHHTQFCIILHVIFILYCIILHVIFKYIYIYIYHIICYIQLSIYLSIYLYLSLSIRIYIYIYIIYNYITCYITSSWRLSSAISTLRRLAKCSLNYLTVEGAKQTLTTLQSKQLEN